MDKQYVLILDDQQEVYALWVGTEEQIQRWLDQHKFVDVVEPHTWGHSSNEVDGVVEARKDKDNFRAIVLDVQNWLIEPVPGD